MKTSNNSPADNEVAENDTPNALISDNDLLKFFNLERENVQDFSITRRKDGMYVNITLNKTWVQCPVCGHMTSRVKDYTDKKITHSVLSITSCYIIYSMFSEISRLQMQPLLMSLEDMAYPLHLLLIFSTNMSKSPEDSFLNAWLWMKYTPSSLMTVIMYV